MSTGPARAAVVPPSSTHSERRVAEAGALLVAFFWAANFIIVKAATDVIPPVAFAFLRYALTAVAMLIALRLREGDLRLPRADVLPILGLGAIGFGIYQILWTTALRSIPAGDSALIIASTPVLTALFAVLARSDILTRPKLVGAAVSFLGVGIVIAAGPGLGVGTGGALGSVAGGDLLTLVAAVCWAIYTSWGAPILRRHSPLRTTTWAIVGGTLVLAPLGLIQTAGNDWSRVGLDAGMALVYSGLVAAGLSNVLVFRAIRLLGPTRIAAYQFLVPFIAVVLGALLLAESVRVEQVVGGVVIIGGVALMRVRALGRPIPRLASRRRLP